MDLRHLGPAEYDDLVHLWERAGLPYRPRGRDSRRSIEQQMRADPEGFIGAYADGELVGVVVATFEGRKGWINRLAVDPEHRRHGVARALVAAAEGQLRKRGARIIAALIEDWNEASLAFFQCVGYKVQRDVIYVSKRDDETV